MGRNGGPKSGGRQKGSLNKTTELLFDLVEKKKLEPLEGLRKSMKELNDIKCFMPEEKISKVKAKISIYMEILKYLYPRRKAVELGLKDEAQDLTLNRIIKLQWADEDDTSEHSDSETEKENPSSNSDKPVADPV